jgi:hypothetical protein
MHGTMDQFKSNEIHFYVTYVWLKLPYSFFIIKIRKWNPFLDNRLQYVHIVIDYNEKFIKS